MTQRDETAPKAQPSRGSVTLKALADEIGLRELARRLRKSPGLVSQWANGLRKPGRDNAPLIARRAKVPARYWSLPLE